MGDPFASRRLALEIARCPVIAEVLGGAASPCHDVVMFQKRPASDRWVAEPWSGHLDQAPLLFLSSNPNSGDPQAPSTPGDLTAASADEEIWHSFDGAFDKGPWVGIEGGTHLRGADGLVGKYVSYWGSCKTRASELLGRPAVPGHDYALSEVVHCGSQHEIGVRAAATQCVARYLNRVMAISPATVVVVVGAVARDIVRASVPGLAPDQSCVGPIGWSGRERWVLMLPHPNARRVPKGVAAYLGSSAASDMAAMRQSMRDAV